MKENVDVFVYMMAAEKITNLIFTIEHTMQFMEEYAVLPDDEVKKALNPLIKKINDWTKNEKSI